MWTRGSLQGVCQGGGHCCDIGHWTFCRGIPSKFGALGRDAVEDQRSGEETNPWREEKGSRATVTGNGGYRAVLRVCYFPCPLRGNGGAELQVAQPLLHPGLESMLWQGATVIF